MIWTNIYRASYNWQRGHTQAVGKRSFYCLHKTRSVQKWCQILQKRFKDCNSVACSLTSHWKLVKIESWPSPGQNSCWRHDYGEILKRLLLSLQESYSSSKTPNLRLFVFGHKTRELWVGLLWLIFEICKARLWQSTSIW